MLPPLLSIAQVSDLLGCSRSRVFELLREGTLERAPRFGRALRIYTTSLLRALERKAPRSVKARTQHFDLDDVRL